MELKMEPGPVGGLVEGTDGNFYGTTDGDQGYSGNGTIYKMSPSGTRTIIHAFGNDGLRPNGLTAGSDGNMYGATFAGGSHSDGTIFKLSSQSNVSTVYNFGTNTTLDGAEPTPPVLTSDGNFYGTTNEVAQGEGRGGAGLLYKVTAQGQFTVLHQFGVGVTFDGSEPSGLLQGQDGNLYGTTASGGSLYGTFYEETLTAPAPLPVITGLLSRTGRVGTVFPLYQIIASNSTQVYGATGLPPGLSVDMGLGVISGTPTESGIFPVTLSATNTPGGTTTRTLTLTISGPPTITNGPPPAYVAGTPYSFTFHVQAYPAATTFLSSGSLPPGLVLSAAGVISGTPTSTGEYAATVSASNGTAPNATQSFTLKEGLPPEITSSPLTTFAMGQAGNFTVTASGDPAPTYSSVGLPAWANLNATTGVLSGTPPNANGSPFTISVTAANGNLPNATKVLTLTVQPALDFSDWAGSHGLSGDAAASPESDGVPNFLKYSYNIDPTVPMTSSDRAALPTSRIATIASVQDMTLTYRQNSLQTGVSMGVESSSDLQTWTPVAPSAIVQVGNDPVTGDPMMQARVPTNGAAHLFMRLSLTP